MLWTSCLVLFVLWLLALLLDVGGRAIHALPVVAILLILLRIGSAARRP
jgi:hypothetical protein